MLMCDEFDINSCYNEYDEELEIVESSSRQNSSEQHQGCNIVTQVSQEDQRYVVINNENKTHDEKHSKLHGSDFPADYDLAKSTSVDTAVKFLSRNSDIMARFSTDSESSSASIINSSPHYRSSSARIYSNLSGSQSFVCDVCNKGFALKKYLRQHQLIHFGVRRFQCTICQQRFLRLGDLTRHYTIHSGERKYKCHQCDLSFTRKCYLNKHMVMHGEQYEGSESISDTLQINQNGATAESELSQSSFPCEASGDAGISESCEVSCQSLPNLTNSQTIKHDASADDGSVLYECSVCDKMFTSRHYLRQHERIHFGKKIYECQICGERFQRMASLKEHSEVHSTEPTKLVNPLEIQLKDGQFLCDICGKGFQRKDSVKQHRVTHLSERLFHCNQCSKTFVHSSSLYKHKLKHKLSSSS